MTLRLIQGLIQGLIRGAEVNVPPKDFCGGLINKREWLHKLCLGILSLSFIIVSVSCGDKSSSSSAPATNTLSGEVPVPVSTELDTDGDGFVNAYDTEYLDADFYVYGNGSGNAPFLITNIYQLQAIAGVDHTGVPLNQSIYTNFRWMYGSNKTAQLEADYLVEEDIDARITSSWTSVAVNATLSIAGFTPIGSCDTSIDCSDDGVTAFNGRFSGGANTLSDLHISRGASTRVGLFGLVGPRGVITSTKLVNTKINGLERVGGLVGDNHGQIYACDVAGNIAGSLHIGILIGENQGRISASSAMGESYGDLSIGGLLGFNIGRVEYSYANARVNGGRIVGGLIGFHRGELFDSYADGIITGTDGIGGLVGINLPSSVVTNSYFRGEVIGTDNVGGLIGVNQDSATVVSSHVSAAVNGDFSVGGLIGFNQGEVFLSYTEGSASGEDAVGGLVGQSNGTISTSYFEGNVTGTNQVGGLAGLASNYITHSYAKGNVQGEDKIGGLVGEYNQTFGINASYAITDITIQGGAAAATGGLVGEHPLGFVTDSHWQGEEFQVLRHNSRGGRASKKQITNCRYGLMANADENSMCQGVFSSAAWGSQITHNNLGVSWYFDDQEASPILVTRALNEKANIPVSYCSLDGPTNKPCRTKVLLDQVKQGQEIIRFVFDRFTGDGNQGQTRVAYDSLESQPKTDLFVVDNTRLLRFVGDPNAIEATTYRIKVSFIKTVIKPGRRAIEARTKTSNIDTTIVVTLINESL